MGLSVAVVGLGFGAEWVPAYARHPDVSRVAVCDLNEVVDYYRLSADKRLLYGGRCNYSGREPASIKAAITIVARWDLSSSLPTNWILPAKAGTWGKGFTSNPYRPPKKYRQKSAAPAAAMSSLSRGVFRNRR